MPKAIIRPATVFETIRYNISGLRTIENISDNWTLWEQRLKSLAELFESKGYPKVDIENPIDVDRLIVTAQEFRTSLTNATIWQDSNRQYNKYIGLKATTDPLATAAVEQSEKWAKIPDKGKKEYDKSFSGNIYVYFDDKKTPQRWKPEDVGWRTGDGNDTPSSSDNEAATPPKVPKAPSKERPETQSPNLPHAGKSPASLRDAVAANREPEEDLELGPPKTPVPEKIEGAGDAAPAPPSTGKGSYPGYRHFQQIYGRKLSQKEYKEKYLDNDKLKELWDKTRAEKEFDPRRKNDMAYLQIVFPDPDRSDRMNTGIGPRLFDDFISKLDYTALDKILGDNAGKFYGDPGGTLKLWQAISLLRERHVFNDKFGAFPVEKEAYGKGNPMPFIKALTELNLLSEILDTDIGAGVQRLMIEKGLVQEDAKEPDDGQISEATDIDKAEEEEEDDMASAESNPLAPDVEEPKPQNNLLTAAKFDYGYSDFISNHYSKYSKALNKQQTYNIFARADNIADRMRAVERASLVDGQSPDIKFRNWAKRVIVQ